MAVACEPMTSKSKETNQTSSRLTAIPTKIYPISTRSQTDQNPFSTPTLVKTTVGQQSSDVTILDVVKLCPAPEKVLVNEFEFAGNSKLIMSREDSLAFYDFNSNKFLELPVQGRNPVLSVPFWFQISPDRNWFAYYARNLSNDKNSIFDLWISTIDGSTSWKAATTLPRYSWIRWDQNDEITVWTSESDINTCYRPWLQINPFTKVESLFDPKFPEADWPNCQTSTEGKWFSPDYSKCIYYSDGWKIFDYPTGKINVAFPWLPSEGMKFPGKIDIKWNKQGISIIRLFPDHIQFLLDLSLEESLKPGMEFKDIMLNFSQVDQSIVDWLGSGDQIAFDSIPLSNEKSTNSNISSFSILDLRKNILYDYCLNRGDAQFTVFLSPDNRFLAWTKYEDASRIKPKAIVILDKETGKIAEIESTYEVRGWAMGDK